MEEENYLIETDQRHSDFVDSYAYMIAGQMAKLRDAYVLLYVKKKPRFLPEFVYKWILKKLLVLSEFRS